MDSLFLRTWLNVIFQWFHLPVHLQLLPIVPLTTGNICNFPLNSCNEVHTYCVPSARQHLEWLNTWEAFTLPITEFQYYFFYRTQYRSPDSLSFWNLQETSIRWHITLMFIFKFYLIKLVITLLRINMSCSLLVLCFLHLGTEYLWS